MAEKVVVEDMSNEKISLYLEIFPEDDCVHIQAVESYAGGDFVDIDLNKESAITLRDKLNDFLDSCK